MAMRQPLDQRVGGLRPGVPDLRPPDLPVAAVPAVVALGLAVGRVRGERLVDWLPVAVRWLLGGRRRSEHVLSTNYRNSAEIFAVAASVVRHAEPDIELPVAVRRTGVEPKHV